MNAHPSSLSDSDKNGPSRYHGPPPIVLVDASGQARLAPYLLDDTDVVDLFRLRDSKTRFTTATLSRYRQQGLRRVRVGRRAWYRLPDVLEWLERKLNASVGEAR